MYHLLIFTKRMKLFTGAAIKSMNQEYPWFGTIRNADELDPKSMYTLHATDYGSLYGRMYIAKPVEIVDV